MIEQRYADLFTQGSQINVEIAEREIVLTYVLKILEDAGLLKTLAFKGGTCLRKCVYGKDTRFSIDLDLVMAEPTAVGVRGTLADLGCRRVKTWGGGPGFSGTSERWERGPKGVRFPYLPGGEVAKCPHGRLDSGMGVG